MECRTLLYPFLYGILKQARFLIARLHMDSLRNKPTIDHIKRAILDLPRGMNGLEAIYKEAINRIDRQDEDIRCLARRILSWMTRAKYQLKVLTYCDMPWLFKKIAKSLVKNFVLRSKFLVRYVLASLSSKTTPILFV
jgi:hypothetical protein